MVVEWTISIGSVITAILTLFAWIAGAVVFIFALKSTLAIQAERLLMLSGRMINVENEIKELKNVLVQQAAQRAEIAATQERMNRMEARLIAIETIRERGRS